MSATPEPMLMIVGMMLNFPAWSTEKQSRLNMGRGHGGETVGSLGTPACPTPDLPSLRMGDHRTHLAIDHHIKADPIGFHQRAELHSSSISVIFGEPSGDLPCLAMRTWLLWRFISTPKPLLLAAMGEVMDPRAKTVVKIHPDT